MLHYMLKKQKQLKQQKQQQQCRPQQHQARCHQDQLPMIGILQRVTGLHYYTSFSHGHCRPPLRMEPDSTLAAGNISQRNTVVCRCSRSRSETSNNGSTSWSLCHSQSDSQPAVQHSLCSLPVADRTHGAPLQGSVSSGLQIDRGIRLHHVSWNWSVLSKEGQLTVRQLLDK